MFHSQKVREREIFTDLLVESSVKRILNSLNSPKDTCFQSLYSHDSLDTVSGTYWNQSEGLETR